MVGYAFNTVNNIIGSALNERFEKSACKPTHLSWALILPTPDW